MAAAHLQSAYAWPDVLIDTILDNVDHASLQHQSLLGSCYGCDSDFSGGCCAWECSASMIESAAAARGLFVDLQPQTVCDTWLQVSFVCSACLVVSPFFACQEYDPKMAEAASTFLPAKTCVFSDVLEIWGQNTTRLQEHLNGLQRYADKLKTAWKMPVYSTAWCSRHCDQCPVASALQLRPRVQSPPCPDWSNAGARRGLNGPTIAATLAGGRKAAYTQAPCVVIENVPAFPEELAADAYGPDYMWQSFIFTPDDVGFDFIARKRTGSHESECSPGLHVLLCCDFQHVSLISGRKFLVGVNTKVAELTFDLNRLLEAVHSRLRRHGTQKLTLLSMQDVCAAHNLWNLFACCPELAARPRSVILSDLSDVAEDTARLLGKSVPSMFLESMDQWTAAELWRADEYVRQWENLSGPKCDWWDLICHVGDDPRTGWTTWSGRSSKIPTLRRSSGLMIWPAGHRHLTLRELYAAMGFPTTQALAAVARVPVYDHFRGLTYSQSRQALGNSQVVPQIGCVVACALACISFRSAVNESADVESV